MSIYWFLLNYCCNDAHLQGRILSTIVYYKPVLSCSFSYVNDRWYDPKETEGLNSSQLFSLSCEPELSCDPLYALALVHYSYPSLILRSQCQYNIIPTASQILKEIIIKTRHGEAVMKTPFEREDLMDRKKLQVDNVSKELENS